LLFQWEPPRKRRAIIAGFLLASVALHALCFYLFQVVYPPAIVLLPPPAQVSVIAPTTPEARTFLTWLEAEDPALSSHTQRPSDARAFQLPRLAHIPSYVAVPPRLKELPPQKAAPAVPSAMPPAPVPVPVPVPSSGDAVTPMKAATSVTFSDGLAERPFTHPTFNFSSSMSEAPENASFRIAVDTSGVVRYAFLERSSGDSGLDEQAHHYLVLGRFAGTPSLPKDSGLIWATANFEFGNDLKATEAEHTP
jgi:hypothetical protein